MRIYNREYRFRLTIGAAAELSEICPNKDIGKIQEMLQKDYGTNVEFTAKMAAIMSKAHEMAARFESGEKPEEKNSEPLSKEMVLALEPKVYYELQKEVYEAFAQGAKTTVEVEPEKKTKGEKK